MCRVSFRLNCNYILNKDGVWFKIKRETVLHFVVNVGAFALGFIYFKCIDTIQNRSMIYHLRVSPVTALIGETGWLSSIFRQWLSIRRVWNRLLLKDER